AWAISGLDSPFAAISAMRRSRRARSASGLAPNASATSSARRNGSRAAARWLVRRKPRAWLPFDAVISTNQLKNDNHIEVGGTVFKVLEFQHVKPGKGGAFVRTKLRRAADGAVIDKTFRAGEKFRQVNTEN